MRSTEIQNLIDAVEGTWGRVELYGSDPTEEHGTAFMISGIPATFSVITLEGTLPPGRYDIQIEGVPPGDYLYTEEVSLEKFLQLIQRMSGPEDTWP